MSTVQNSAIADAINNLAREVRFLTFGGAGASMSTPSHYGAIEGLTMAVNDTGRGIVSALSEVADAINKLADTVADLKDK
ncbi:MAG: hypothetical protein FWF31_09055 [Desulfobulbus sp.]|nr:hypothetical protein [Desulfobulbus sp.]